MNIHILKDNKFYDDMSKVIIDKNLVDNNIYFIFRSKEHDYKAMKPYPNSVIGGEEDLFKIRLSDYDKAIFHNLADTARISFLAHAGKSKGRCLIYWRLWQGDNYAIAGLANIMTKPLWANHSQIHDNDKDFVVSLESCTNILKNIRARIRYRHKYRIICQALENVDYALNWNEFEVDAIRELYSVFNAQFLYHAYHTSELYNDVGGYADEVNKELRVCVGHSGDGTFLNHEQVFMAIRKILDINDTNFRVVTPLSYGNTKYIDHVLRMGQSLFGQYFEPILDFMEYPDYMKLLSQCDVFVFGQKYIPCAAGNISAVLKMGKRVIMPSTNPMYRMYIDDGVCIFDLDELISGNHRLLESLPEDIKQSNINRMRTRYELMKSIRLKTLMEIIT